MNLHTGNYRMNRAEKENAEAKAESEVTRETKEKYEGSTMSKAGKLAMELAEEKRRLVSELSELQEQYESAKPTTPVGTPDWYVKWSATILAVVGVFIMSAGMVTVGQIMYALAGVCWIFVGMQWSDRAIMIGSAITTTAVCMNLVQTFFG